MRMCIKCDDTRRFVALALLKPDWITAANRATPHDGSVNTDVDLIVLGRRAQNSRILGQISLEQGCHHATPARASDVQAHRRPDGERVAGPRILGKALFP